MGAAGLLVFPAAGLVGGAVGGLAFQGLVGAAAGTATRQVLTGFAFTFAAVLGAQLAWGTGSSSSSTTSMSGSSAG